MPRLGALLVLALLVVACGGTTSAPSMVLTESPDFASPSASQPVAEPSAVEASPYVAPSPSAAATPTQEQIRHLAAVAYQRAAKKSNTLDDALYKKYRNATSLRSLRRFCAGLSTSEHKFIATIKAIVYPDDTKSDAKALIRLAAGEEAHLRGCAKAASIANWNDQWREAGRVANRRTEAANLLRLDLDLPPVN
jgi:hypothetical protein